MELSTAVKPYLLQRLFARGHGKVLYLDPDIWVFRPLDALFAWLDDVRRAADPAPDGAARRREVPRRARHPPLGHLQPRLPRASRGRPQVDALLAWWAERCEFFCVSDITPRHVRRPALDGPGARASSDRVRDRARPRLQRRLLEPQAPPPLRDRPGPRWSNGEPVRFYHWSGFDPRKPTALSKHQDRYPDDRDRAAPVHGARVQRGAPVRGLPGQLGLALRARRRSGTAIPSRSEMRDLFREHPPGRFPDPVRAGGRGLVRDAGPSQPPPAGGPAPLRGAAAPHVDAAGPLAALAPLAARARPAQGGDQDPRAAARGPAAPRAAAPARGRRSWPGAPTCRRRSRVPGRRRRPPGVPALAVARRHRAPQAQALLVRALAGARRGRRA